MTTTDAQLREVKARLRATMNGVAAARMRQLGMRYRLIFGTELPRLQALADELPHTAELAARLWQEDIRECHLLAAMLMPVEAFQQDLAEVWLEQMHTTEEIECTTLHLLQHAPYATTILFAWIASPERMKRIAGWTLAARLFMQGKAPSERDADELLDHLQCDLHATDSLIQKAAYKALLKYMGLSAAANAHGERLLAAL